MITIIISVFIYNFIRSFWYFKHDGSYEHLSCKKQLLTIDKNGYSKQAAFEEIVSNPPVPNSKKSE